MRWHHIAVNLRTFTCRSNMIGLAKCLSVALCGIFSCNPCKPGSLQRNSGGNIRPEPVWCFCPQYLTSQKSWWKPEEPNVLCLPTASDWRSSVEYVNKESVTDGFVWPLEHKCHNMLLEVTTYSQWGLLEVTKCPQWELPLPPIDAAGWYLRRIQS